jgi:hypothetical protein
VLATLYAAAKHLPTLADGGSNGARRTPLLRRMLEAIGLALVGDHGP